MKFYFSFPSRYLDPPKGTYSTIDYLNTPGWNDVIQVPNYSMPMDLAHFFSSSNLPNFPLVPASEEAVLATGLVNSIKGTGGLSLQSAILCTDRYQQRKHIADIYCPSWAKLGEIDFYTKKVVKAPASTLNLGVEILNPEEDERLIKSKLEIRACDYIEALRSVGGSNVFIVEEYVIGHSFEISGILDQRGKIIHVFNCLKQSWQNDKISEYYIDNHFKEQFIEIAQNVVSSLKMKFCAFCMEIKGPPWKVIEIHARLGEDSGDYYSLLSDIPPAQVILNKLSQLY